MQGISEEGADSPPFPEWATSEGGVLPLDNSFNDNPFPCFRSNALFNFSTSFDVTTNARMKKYLNKAVVQVANADVFPACNYELYDSKIAGKRKRSYDVPPKGQAVNPQRALEESQRRAASKIRDIALCNHFTHFFTWTLSSDMIDRYDVQEIYKKLRVFLSNVSRRKNFQYVLVPEYHKKKEGEERPALHFHGLCVLGKVSVVRACCKDGSFLFDSAGREIYNMIDWKYGFSTCVPLDENYLKAVNYVCKYISKSEEKIFGKWYLSSRSLVKSPDIIPLARIDFDSFVDSNRVQVFSNIYNDVVLVSEDYLL